MHYNSSVIESTKWVHIRAWTSVTLTARDGTAYLPMVLMPLTPRFKHACLSRSIGVDMVASAEQKQRHASANLYTVKYRNSDHNVRRVAVA